MIQVHPIDMLPLAISILVSVAVIVRDNLSFTESAAVSIFIVGSSMAGYYIVVALQQRVRKVKQ